MRAVVGRCVRSVSENKPFEWKQFIVHPTYTKKTFQPNTLFQQKSTNTNWIRRIFYLDAWILSKIYGFVLRIRRSRHLSSSSTLYVPVISIGNLTWGGNGKTPMTETISRMIYSEYSKIPLGYSEDEVQQLKQNLPNSLFGVGSNRLEVAKSVLQANPQEQNAVCVLDDGLQFFSLKKDLELTMINALDPFGNGSLIPLGKLREHPQDGLERSHVAAIHHANLVPRESVLKLTSKLQQYNPRLAIIETSMEPVFFKNAITGSKVSLHEIQQKNVIIFCGLGQPEALYCTIAQLQPLTMTVFEFLDHHKFTKKELQAVIEDAVENTSVVITTEKDFHRCPELITECFTTSNTPLLILHSELKVTQGREILKDKIKEIIQRKQLHL